ncbi:unnamed protein product [Linum trigynum]|uniref:Uncharacterized protein n=1 Tax=Linum trigynum TaxID=586398 RepID=A0AAV2E595_9ROSI
MEAVEAGELENTHESGTAGMPASRAKNAVRSPRRFPVPKSPKIRLARGSRNRTPKKNGTAVASGAGRVRMTTGTDRAVGAGEKKGQAQPAADELTTRSVQVGASQDKGVSRKKERADDSRAIVACDEQFQSAAAGSQVHRRRLILSDSEDEAGEEICVEPPTLKMKRKTMRGGRRRLVKAAVKGVSREGEVRDRPHGSPPVHGEGEASLVGAKKKKKDREVTKRGHHQRLSEMVAGEGEYDLPIKASSLPSHTMDGMVAKSPSSALVESAASLSEEEENCFEIKSRSQSYDSGDSRSMHGRVQQVVAAFESGVLLKDDDDAGHGKQASPKEEDGVKVGHGVGVAVEADSVLDEYGTNFQQPALVSHKRQLEEVEGEMGDDPLPKRQFVEDNSETVEEASRKWPQADK